LWKHFDTVENLERPQMGIEREESHQFDVLGWGKILFLLIWP